MSQSGGSNCLGHFHGYEGSGFDHFQNHFTYVFNRTLHHA